MSVVTDSDSDGVVIAPKRSRHRRVGCGVDAGVRQEIGQLLFLTANNSVEDRIAGLSAGGDGYVAKPISVEELALRSRALLRRTGVAVSDDESKIAVGDLVLDED